MTASDSGGPAAAPAPAGVAARVLLALSMILVALNLRPVFSSASVLLPEIVETTGLSAVGAGVLTTLPVLCLGLFAPLAPRLAARIGTERALLAVLLVLALGTGLRGFGTGSLFAGTVLAGAAIGVGNVLLPGLIKRDFAHRTALMTGFHTMALCGGAAIAAGLTVPLEIATGRAWPTVLSLWAVPALVAALVWLPQTMTGNRNAGRARVRVEGLWRDPLAWQVTLFMGLQSAFAYSIFGWLAPILRFRGMEAGAAGAVVSASVMVQVAASLAVPAIAVRCRDQRGVLVALVAVSTIAFMGFLFAPLSTVWLWAMLQGIGQGGLLAAALTVIVLRSPDSHVAAHLSGMAQFIGYLLAATGPLLVGVIRGVTGGFSATAFLFVFIGLCATLAGLGAGRALHVGARSVEG